MGTAAIAAIAFAAASGSIPRISSAFSRAGQFDGVTV